MGRDVGFVRRFCVGIATAVTAWKQKLQSVTNPGVLVTKWLQSISQYGLWYILQGFFTACG